MVGASSHKPKGRRFDSVGTCAWISGSGLSKGACKRRPMSVVPCVDVSLSLPLSPKSISMSSGEDKKEKKRNETEVQRA